MKALHVICKRKPKGQAGRVGVQRVENEQDVFSSDAWVTQKWTPETIIGATLYMHETQATASEFGGEVLRCELISPKSADQPRDRYRLIFRATHDSRGVKWQGARGQTEQGGLVET